MGSEDRDIGLELVSYALMHDAGSATPLVTIVQTSKACNSCF